MLCSQIGVSYELLVKCVGDNALSERTVARWLQLCREGKVKAEDLPKEGRSIYLLDVMQLRKSRRHCVN